jgi:hypothetical protein
MGEAMRVTGDSIMTTQVHDPASGGSSEYPRRILVVDLYGGTDISNQVMPVGQEKTRYIKMPRREIEEISKLEKAVVDEAAVELQVQTKTMERPDLEEFNEAIKRAETLILTADVEKNHDVQFAHQLAQTARSKGLPVIGVLGSRQGLHAESDKVRSLRDFCNFMIMMNRCQRHNTPDREEAAANDTHALPDTVSLAGRLQAFDGAKLCGLDSTEISGQIMVAGHACSRTECALLEATSRAVSQLRETDLRTSGTAFVHVVSQKEVTSDQKKKVIDIVRDSIRCDNVIVLTGIDESAPTNETRVTVLLAQRDGSVNSILKRRGVFELLDLDPDEYPEEPMGIDLNLYQLEDL